MEGIMSSFYSAQAGYLARHLGDRKFIIQALTSIVDTGIEFDCIIKHTALRLHFIASKVEVEKQ